MNTTEFDREFDILWNNIMSNQAPNLNAYEKSVFLTQGQEDICRELYSGKTTSFEDSEDNTASLSAIIDQLTFHRGDESNLYPALSAITSTDNKRYVFVGTTEVEGFSDKLYKFKQSMVADPAIVYIEGVPIVGSLLLEKDTYTPAGEAIKTVSYSYSREHLNIDRKLDVVQFRLPDSLYENIWYMLYESASISTSDCRNGKSVRVKPIKLDDVHHIVNNPFVFPKSGRNVLRVSSMGDPTSTLTNRVVELVSRDTIESYTVRYLRKPKPIVLVDLSVFGDLSIDGVSVKTECELNESLHRMILRRAVSLAQLAWGSK